MDCLFYQVISLLAIPFTLHNITLAHTLCIRPDHYRKSPCTSVCSYLRFGYINLTHSISEVKVSIVSPQNYSQASPRVCACARE